MVDQAFMIPAPGGGQPAAANRVQTASPTAGQTVTVTQDAVDTTVYLTPAGTLATLTLTLPANAVSRLGQNVSFETTQAVTTPTFNGAASISGAPSTLNAGDSVTFRKVASDTWVKVL